MITKIQNISLFLKSINKVLSIKILVKLIHKKAIIRGLIIAFKVIFCSIKKSIDFFENYLLTLNAFNPGKKATSLNSSSIRNN